MKDTVDGINEAAWEWAMAAPIPIRELTADEARGAVSAALQRVLHRETDAEKLARLERENRDYVTANAKLLGRLSEQASIIRACNGAIQELQDAVLGRRKTS